MSVLSQDAGLLFDGINDYVQIGPSASLSLTKQITIEAWVWPAGVTGNLVTKADNWRSVGNYNLSLQDGKPVFSYFDGTGYNSYYYGGASLTPGNWQHVAVTYDFSTFAVAVYIDGAATGGSWYDGAGADPPDRVGAAVNSNPVVIGATVTVTDGHGLTLGSSLSAFTGAVDEVRIWSVIRSPSEIAASRPNELTGQQAGLIGCWRFNSGEGATATDDGPNGLTGLLGGGYPSRRPQWLPAGAQPFPLGCQGCGTLVGGTIGNAVWRNSTPYCVTNDVFVIGNLVIAQGVEVRFCGNYEFKVGGTLRVKGTADAPVHFRPADPEVGWQGLVFPNTQAGSYFAHAIIEGSKHGGLRLTNSAPPLTNCWIINNSSPEGGAGIKAMIGSAGDWVLQGCVLSNNAANGYGGGLRLDLTSGLFLAQDCVFSANEAVRLGGGVATTSGSKAKLRFVRCTNVNNFVGPMAGGSGVGGGGFLFAGPENVWVGHYEAELIGCTITNNTAKGWPGNWVYGGGVNQNGGTTFLRNCWITDNVVTGSGAKSGALGGGINQSANESCTIENCIIARNSVMGTDTRWGAGVVQDGANMTIVNSTIVANRNGPGLTLETGSVAVTNSIIYFNNNGGQQIGRVTGNITMRYSCIQNGWPGEGNIDSDPALWPHNYSLGPASRCIDAGSPDLLYRDGCVDHFGEGTPLARGTPRNDMGAYGGPLVCCWTDPCDQPAIRIQPDNVIVLEGDTAEMGVVATGAPPMIYQWYKGGHYIEGATNAVLRIPKVELAHASPAINETNTYWALVDNDWNQRLTTREVWLMVTQLGLSVSLEQGDLWLTIRRNEPDITKCRILSATNILGPWEPFDEVDLIGDVTRYEVKDELTDDTRFFLVEPSE